MKKIKSNYSLKEKVLISFSFWPTLLIGVALGMAISLLLFSQNFSIFQLMPLMKNSIIVLVILGVITRVISLYIWKKYNWSFKSDLK
ncbi:hypothetical protein W908_03225 [Candidatus Pseudothioglobus singularis PS1]|jgi:hypothetical protein|uniref:Chloride channel protein n=1 Tax=Candidatus Pseudothioglobus singularis PS1 TaxID=1125411 RepID=A0A0M3T2D4_9GAMM|nr:hypothetical protein W908_03225 [Candidatus Pseudothioglobus singularis PS1]|tara:strand:+ start:132 stop:392 length:261 start_codon:yes stop_codon:yes gene_type:complete